MKTKQLILFIALLYSGIQSYAQCSKCSDPANMITYAGNNTFTAQDAQAYYWEVCEGNAFIIGSNTNQNVLVRCRGSYKVKVTRFQNGACIEACEARRCGIGSGCPSSNNIGYNNEGGGGLCTTGQAFINGISNVDHIDWTWRLGGHSGSINNAGTTTPIYYPSGNWSNYYIAVCATVFFTDGRVCREVCRSFLLNCGTSVGSPIRQKTSAFPNPTKDGAFSTRSIKGKPVLNTVITNTNGSVVQAAKGHNFDLSTEKNGIYFVQTNYEDGTSDIQRVVLKRE